NAVESLRSQAKPRSNPAAAAAPGSNTLRAAESRRVVERKSSASEEGCGRGARIRRELGCPQFERSWRHRTHFGTAEPHRTSLPSVLTPFASGLARRGAPAWYRTG